MTDEYVEPQNITLGELCKEIVEDKLKEAILLSIKDFKATLFIEQLIINKCDNNYEIKNIILDN